MKIESLIFWCCLFFAASLLTVRPAHAASVQPTNQYSCVAQFGSCPVSQGTQSVMSASCASQAAATWPTLGVQYYQYNRNYTNGTEWACGVPNHTNMSYRILAFTTTMVGAASCPSGYTFNSTSGMCDPPADPCAGQVVTQTFPITAACLSPTSSLTCAPATITVACGTLVKNPNYDCMSNATGTLCSASYGSSLAAYPAAPSPPSQACPSGQSLVTGSNGYAKCFNDMTGGIASAVAAANTAAASAAASAAAAAGTAASAVGGAAAVPTAIGTSIAGGGGGGGAVLGASSAGMLIKNADVAALCTADPANALCQPKQQGHVQAATASGLPANGTGSWYTKRYPSGISGVLTTNFNTMKTTPLFSLINNIVPTINATASTGCFTISVWHMGNQQLCIPTIALQMIGICMLLTALFAARAIIFGG